MSEIDSSTELALKEGICKLLPDMWQGRFIRPRLGEELVPLLDQETPESPAATRMVVRLMKLPSNIVIPRHRHEIKEKIYQQVKGAAVVWLFLSGNWHRCELQPGKLLAVPAECWHCVVTGSGESETFVFMAPPDPGIEWEPEADALIASTAEPASPPPAPPPS